MKTEYWDWTILKLPVVVFSGSLIVSAGIVLGGYYYEKTMGQELSSNQAKFKQVSRQYLRVDEEKDLIREYYPRFIDLYNQGLFGKEKRLNWIEAIRAIGDALEIPSIRYEIESQKPATGKIPVDSSRFKIYESVMNLQLDMLHEADLVRFLDRLDRYAMGLYSVSKCELVRRNRLIDVSSKQPNISADCNLVWYSIKPEDGSEITF